MKKQIFSNFAAAALFLGLAFPAIAPAAPKTAKPAGSAAATTATAADPARHPEIRAAIESLERAKGHLQEARHDFGGHRLEAVRAIDEALRQLHVCQEFDR